MTVHVKIYLVKDSHGNTGSATCECSSDIIQICGMKDEDGNNLYFESDAYHLETWCTDNGLEYQNQNTTHGFENLWD